LTNLRRKRRKEKRSHLAGAASTAGWENRAPGAGNPLHPAPAGLWRDLYVAVGRQSVGEEMKRILIVDDHEIVRDGVKRLFEEQPESAVFGEASTAPEAHKLVGEQDWDVVILDLSLGGRNGLEFL
jgi:hypothetical protein